MKMILTKDVKDYCAERKDELRRAVEARKPHCRYRLTVIQVGNNEASNRYVKHKQKDCEEVGIEFIKIPCEENITTKNLIKIIDEIKDTNGLIVQLPLPPHIDTEAVKLAINPAIDVDGFHPLSKFMPCTPKGIIDYLEKGCGYDFTGKNVVVIGRSDIVGKPLAAALTDRNATVTLCHSKTKNLHTFIKTADLIVCAVGKTKFLNCYPIHVPVIDVGINFDENGKLVGDCYNTEGRDVTPVPGGVGLLTRLALLENTIGGME